MLRRRPDAASCPFELDEVVAICIYADVIKRLCVQVIQAYLHFTLCSFEVFCKSVSFAFDVDEHDFLIGCFQPAQPRLEVCIFHGRLVGHFRDNIPFARHVIRPRCYNEYQVIPIRDKPRAASEPDYVQASRVA